MGQLHTITIIKEDGTDGDTYPMKSESVEQGVADFEMFCKFNPVVMIGGNTISVRK